MAELDIIGTPKYRLTLSEKEAIVLVAILRRVGGDPKFSGRKYSSQILNVLEGKVPLSTSYKFKASQDCIYFDDN